MTINPWEVWLAMVRFEDKPDVKRRPVVITSSSEIYVMALKVTSHGPRNTRDEYELVEWERAGLDKKSTVRVSKRIRLQYDDMVRKIGRLQAIDILAIQNILTRMRYN